jgi:outer membrane protein
LSIRFCLALAGLAISVPALAQEGGAPPPPPPEAPSDPRADFVIAGAGAVVLPDFEGSSDYGFTAAPGAVGQVDGFRFLLAGNRFSVDLIRDGYGPTWDVQAGPIAVVNFNRINNDAISDPRVSLLAERSLALEVGGYAGIGKTGVLTSDYDRLSATLSYRHDVTGVHKSGIWAPTVAYTTPLSTRALVGLFVSAEIVGDGYGQTYFSVSPAEAAISGLPAYQADGGFKNWTLGTAFAHSLTGDLTGGLQLVAGGTYRKLVGDFGDSPIVAIAGSRDQWLGAVGLAYSF